MKALRVFVVSLSLSVAVVFLQPQATLAASVDPSPFCQMRQGAGAVTEPRIDVSPDVVPLLSKVKWGSLSVEAAWELAAQVLALSGPMPAALMADQGSRATVKRYVDDIWSRGRFGQLPRYTFGIRDAAGPVTTQSTKESRADALVRFLRALKTAYHETIHYLQMDRCDSLRSASIDKSGTNGATNLRMESRLDTGLVILPISPTTYMTGNSANFLGGTGGESFKTNARTLIEDDVMGTCRTSMDVITSTYFPKAVPGSIQRSLDPISIQGALREAQAAAMDAELISGLEDRLKDLLRGRTTSGHVEAGTFLVYLSSALESLRSIPGAWDVLRAEGTDHGMLWLMNVVAGSWRHRGPTDSGDYPCGRVIFGSALDTAREFVSTAGTPNEPDQWIGRYLSMPSTVKCQRQQVCAFKIDVARPAKLEYVEIGNKRLKFNRKTMEVSGKLPRAGSTSIRVAAKVGKSVYTAEIWVSTT